MSVTRVLHCSFLRKRIFTMTWRAVIQFWSIFVIFSNSQSLCEYLTVSFLRLCDKALIKHPMTFTAFLYITCIDPLFQWLTNLDVASVAVVPNGPLLRFLKFFVPDHRKIQQLRDECSLIKSATAGTNCTFYTGVHIWKMSISRPFYRSTV